MTPNKRFFSKTPKFFRKLQGLGTLLALLGAYFYSPIGLPEGFTIIPIFAKIGGYMVFVGGAITIVSQFAVQSE